MDQPPKIKFVCPSCGRHLAAPPTAVGKVLPCPKCGSTITILPPAPPPRPVGSVPEPESDSSSFIYVACAVVAIAITLGVVYVLLDIDQTESQVAASSVSDKVAHADDPGETAQASTEPEDSAETPADEPEDVSEIGLEELGKMTGHNWIGLDTGDRVAVAKLLAMIVVATDQNVKMEAGALSIDEYLDAYYGNPEHLDTGIYKVGDAYLEHLRGFELRASGPGNLTTDAFYYPGDGYLMFKPKSSGSGGYSVNIYDDDSASIVKANVLMQFDSRLQPQLTRLRLPEGRYYLEINSTVAWEAFVVNTRGMAWLKRVMADEEKNAKESRESKETEGK